MTDRFATEEDVRVLKDGVGFIKDDLTIRMGAMAVGTVALVTAIDRLF
jgi:hypothetical protein